MWDYLGDWGTGRWLNNLLLQGLLENKYYPNRDSYCAPLQIHEIICIHLQRQMGHKCFKLKAMQHWRITQPQHWCGILVYVLSLWNNIPCFDNSEVRLHVLLRRGIKKAIFGNREMVFFFCASLIWHLTRREGHDNSHRVVPQTSWNWCVTHTYRGGTIPVFCLNDRTNLPEQLK